MEDKKKITKKASPIGTRWINHLLDNVFGTIQTFVEGSINSVHEAVHGFTRQLVKRAFLLFFALFGVTLICVGFAEFLSILYKMPGVGEMVVGAFVLLIALVGYAFHRSES